MASQPAVPNVAPPASPPPGAGPATMLPASFAQQQLWLLDRADPLSPVYNIAEAFDLAGDLDVAALQGALSAVAARHEVLRTTFALRQGELMQVIHEPAPLALPLEDLSDLPAAERAARQAACETRLAVEPFDLARGPLARFRLLRLAEQQHVLLTGFHHSVFDGWSASVLAGELSALYTARTGGSAPEPPALPIQYGDYAQWQRQQMRGPELQRLLEYWRGRLAPPRATPELPLDRPRRPLARHRGGHETLVVPAAAADPLLALAARRGATPFMALLAAVKALLYRYAQDPDVVVGTPVANRDRPELAGLIGFFVNTLVLRTAVDGRAGFGDLLAAVRTTVLEALRHAELPFERLVEELAPEREAGRNPLFQVAFLFLPAPPPTPQFPGLRVARRVIDTQTAKFDLLLAATPVSGGVALDATYSAELFDPATVRRMLGHLARLVQAGGADPQRPLDDLPLLDDAERRTVLESFNDTARPYPRDQALPERFAEQVAARPQAVAVAGDGPPLTYADLDRRSGRLADWLRRQGVGPEVRVGLCLERQPELIVGMLAILKAGGAYVPLDPTYPPQRLKLLLDDAGAPVVLTASAHLRALAEFPGRVFAFERDEPSLADPPPGAPAHVAAADHAAYVMYTSGSTGTPKGVVVTHRNIMRLLVGAEYAQFDDRLVCLHLAAIAFDASTFEVWAPLLHGGRCVLCRPRLPSLAQLERVLRDHDVNTLWLTSALFNLVIDQHPQALRGVRQVLTGGEALSVRHVRTALELLPQTRLSNGYGPTETTTFATVHAIDPADPAPGGSVPIGRPIANTRIHILDDHLQPVPIGVRGELWIGGDGVARGYLNQPQLTAERFRPDPFAPGAGARLYRSGDWARWRPDGTIEFLGRRDDQVKIHGFRIEPGEIEARLVEHADVAQAVVAAVADDQGQRRLVAYLVPHAGRPLDAQAVLDWLRGRVPAFLVPSAALVLTGLPLSANGKVDRRRLPPPPAAQARRTAPGAPRSDLERELVQLWGRLLGVPEVGVHDDFFDLGGHSLLAARMFEAVRQRWSVELPLSILLEHRTIAELAPLVSGTRPAPYWSPLVPLQPQGSRPPLFLVHGIGGDILMFRPLIPHIGLEQPLYGLQAHGLNADAEPDPDIPSMAARYLQFVRQVAPRGPYLLGGFSSGGAVALEMAQQLLAAGDEVGLVAMIDTAPPGVRPALGRFSPRFWGRFLWNLPGWIREDLAQNNARQLWQRLRGAARARLRGRRPPAAGPTLDFARVFGTTDLPERRARFIQTLYQGWRRYEPRPYPGRISVLKARVLPLFSRLGPRLGWEAVAGDRVDVYIVPGTHDTILTPRYAGACARTLLRCIDAALAAPGVPAPPAGVVEG